VKEAILQLGDAVEWDAGGERYRIAPKDTPTDLKRQLAETSETLKRTEAWLRIREGEVVTLKRQLAERDAKIAALEAALLALPPGEMEMAS
jgi:hypothetical protein